eukprot:SAG31_NODE_13079_length_894_cov_1.164780_2_plen_172_part_00
MYGLYAARAAMQRVWIRPIRDVDGRPCAHDTSWMMAALWSMGPLLGTTAAAAASAPPNICFVLADDLGFADLGYSSADPVDTPTIDALAAGTPSAPRQTRAKSSPCPLRVRSVPPVSLSIALATSDGRRCEVGQPVYVELVRTVQVCAAPYPCPHPNQSHVRGILRAGERS